MEGRVPVSPLSGETVPPARRGERGGMLLLLVPPQKAAAQRLNFHCTRAMRLLALSPAAFLLHLPLLLDCEVSC